MDGVRRLKPGSLPTENLPQKSFDTESIPRKPLKERPPPPIPEKVTYFDFEDLKSKLQIELQSYKWVILRNEPVLVLRKDLNDWPLCVKIEKDLSVFVYLNGQLVSGYTYCLNNQKLGFVLKMLEQLNVCQGICEFKNDKVQKNNYVHTVIPISCIEGMQPYKSLQVVRANKCNLLVKDCGTCSKCSDAQHLNVSVTQSTLHPNTPLATASTDQLVNTVKTVRKENLKLKKDIQKYMAELETVGVSIQEELSHNFENILEGSGDEFHKLFFKEQKKRWSGKAGKWHPTLIRFALLIHSYSPSVYKLLKNTGILKLPSQSTLIDYTHFIKPQCGFSMERFFELKNLAENFKGHQRCVALMFDEMKISEKLVYSKDEVVGFIDLGSEFLNKLQERQLASHILALHVVGISTDVKYPIAYFAVNNMKAELMYSLIWKCIGLLDIECNLSVVSCTSDGAATNRSFYKMHSKSQSDVCYKAINYFSPEQYVYLIVDAPHLLKTIRNNLFSSGSKQNTRFLKYGDKFLLWSHITNIYKEDQERQLKLMPKLTAEHIYLTPHSKMRVKLAAQVMSDTVSKVMTQFGPQEASETAKLIGLVDRFFDCMNVRSKKEGHYKRKPDLLPFTDPGDARFSFLLTEYLGYFDDWKESISTEPASIRNKKCISYQTYEGLKITCNAIVELTNFLLTDMGMPFVLTNKFCQDCLENHFGRHRAVGRRSENPSVYNYMIDDNKMRVLRDVQNSIVPKGNVTTDKSKITVQIDETPLPKQRKK